MNISLLLIATIFPFTVEYSGEMDVPELGVVRFPAGDWMLEYRTKPAGNGELDALVFKKQGKELERITFIRWHPDVARPLDCYFDSIGDSMSQGIPIQLVGYQSKHNDVHILKPPIAIDESRDGKISAKSASYIYTSKEDANWIGHGVVCQRDGWVLVCCHAAPHVISPEESETTYFDSRLQLESKPKKIR